MKLSLLLCLPTIISASAPVASKSPQRLTHALLTTTDNDNDPLLTALSRDGLVSITSIPNFSTLKHDAFRHFDDCLADHREDFATVLFRDGTIRRSLAMAEGSDSVGDLPETPSCRALSSSLAPFRDVIDSVVEAFAHRLSFEMGSSLIQPLLTGMTSNDEVLMWKDVEEVVSGGEYLDHFHSYQKTVDEGEEKTMEFHIDQGFFLAFTPGLMRGVDGVAGVSEGFYVRDATGKEYEVMFNESDDLVFMLGDGVNQYINGKLTKDESVKSLHATPHALTLKNLQDRSLSRFWFGRMILPPQDAFVSSSDDTTTFGEIRRDIIKHFSTNKKSMVGVGCSSPELEIGLHGVSSNSRNLQECAEEELFCWFSCMALADHNLTTTTCSERNLQLQCTNPRDQVVPDGQMHGDFYPACTNSTDPVTEYPLIEQQDNLTCPDLWEEFLATDEGYDHIVDLTVTGGAETQLMWSLTDDNKIKARFVHNDVFGWLAMGFADPDGGHNGMNGGQVLLATPYGTDNYSPVTGLDTSNAAAIATYVIHGNDTAFRHWQYLVETEDAMATVASFETDECSTAISFESSHINGKEFNTDGTDEMIWAGNSVDYFMGYHGPFGRMRFTINWKSGDVTPFSTSSEDESHIEGSTVSIEDIASDLTETDGESSSVDAKVTESGSPCNHIIICVISVMATSLGVSMFE